jgi:hypothetical protein
MIPALTLSHHSLFAHYPLRVTQDPDQLVAYSLLGAKLLRYSLDLMSSGENKTVRLLHYLNFSGILPL